MNNQAPHHSRLYALHGFLGCKSDWNSFQPASFGVEQMIAMDLFQECSSDSLENWTLGFLSQWKTSVKEQNILMGYSLGGRLALHALTQKPSLWNAAIIISAHPGLIDELGKTQRLQQDKEWAEKFLTEPWGPLLQTWNQQRILMTSQPLQRKQTDHDRIKLAYVLQNLSLGLQQNLRPAIASLPFPILWITGEKDETYTALARSLSFSHPKSLLQIISGSGHRVPWDQPYLFSNQIRQWLSSIL
jgi:2-succinyl-6-hydroxy-2,4-cyclohexadiene-1-carboxylate synthase